MNKKELVEKINSLDALTVEEKSAIIDLLKQKKYGLVWENKPEDVEERLRVELPVLNEVTDKALFLMVEIMRLIISLSKGITLKLLRHLLILMRIKSMLYILIHHTIQATRTLFIMTLL